MDLIAKAVTLKSIKLHDTSAKELLFSAKHSVLYTFNFEKTSWDKTETEGCLAIYKQVNQSIVGNKKNNNNSTVLFILNRLRPENYSCPLDEVRNIQLEGELLMLLRSDNEIMGIWLFDEKERKLACNILQALLLSNVPETGFSQLKPISFTDLLGGKSSNKSPLQNIDVKMNTKIKDKPISFQNDDITKSIHNDSITINSPTILELLSKAKIRDSTDHYTLHNDNYDRLTTEIKSHFLTSNPLEPKTSLKDFTTQTCEFLRSNPHLLASLHRDLIMNSTNKS